MKGTPLNRKELHAFIDAAIDAIPCGEFCQGILIEHITGHTVGLVGLHTARDLAVRMESGEMTASQTYDRLLETMAPVYKAAGQEMTQEDNAHIKRAFLAAANRDLN
jgi:hypothetical protein